jgi:preprotein translocase subunit SecA
MFQNLQEAIAQDIVHTIYHVSIRREAPPPPKGVQKEQQRVVAAREKVKVAAHKVGRNDPCPCGSGKKYKRCCGA